MIKSDYIEEINIKYNKLVSDPQATVILTDWVFENPDQCSIDDWILCLKLNKQQISEFAKFKIVDSLHQIWTYCENASNGSPFDSQIKTCLLETWFKSALISCMERESLIKAYHNGYKSYIVADSQQIANFNLVVHFISS